MFQQLIPLTEDHNVQTMQREFVESLAISYADQQLVKLMSRIPPKARVAITLGILVAPWIVQGVQSIRKGR